MRSGEVGDPSPVRQCLTAPSLQADGAGGPRLPIQTVSADSGKIGRSFEKLSVVLGAQSRV